MEEENTCPQCGSTAFYVEDGKTFCDNGHEQQAGLVTAEDEQDFSKQGKIVRKKEKKTKEKLSKGKRSF